MDEATAEICVALDAELHELLIAEMDEWGFEAYVQADRELKAYLPFASWTEAVASKLEHWLQSHDMPLKIGVQRIQSQDWNHVWERSLAPVAIPPFIVRASWHAPRADTEDMIELVIDPKTSFGTGHHESTRLVLHLLPEAVAPGARVLDAGCGTGILSIAACKLGAAYVLAIDSDRWVMSNVHDNVAANDVAGCVHFELGSIDELAASGFDLIMANVNRAVLLTNLHRFVRALAPGGVAILSGLLRTDRDTILNHARAKGLFLDRERTENEWWSVQLVSV